MTVDPKTKQSNHSLELFGLSEVFGMRSFGSRKKTVEHHALALFGLSEVFGINDVINLQRNIYGSILGNLNRKHPKAPAWGFTHRR